MSKYSIKIELIKKTSLVRVWVRYTENCENDDCFVVDLRAHNFLASTPIPDVHHKNTQSAICDLITNRSCDGVVIYDKDDGWGVGISLSSELDVFLYGFGATPADAIRNSKPNPPLLSKSRRRRLKQ